MKGKAQVPGLKTVNKLSPGSFNPRSVSGEASGGRRRGFPAELGQHNEQRGARRPGGIVDVPLSCRSCCCLYSLKRRCSVPQIQPLGSHPSTIPQGFAPAWLCELPGPVRPQGKRGRDGSRDGPTPPDPFGASAPPKLLRNEPQTQIRVKRGLNM